MSLAIAALGAVAAALTELTVIPYLTVGGAVPHPVLILGLVWAIAAGVEGGLTVAFVGGLALDVLAQRPLGSSAFALLVAIGAAAALAAASGRFRVLAPIVVTAICSPVYFLTFVALYSALRGPVPLADPLAAAIPSAVYDTVLAALVGPLAVAVVLRRREADRMDW